MRNVLRVFPYFLLDILQSTSGVMNEGMMLMMEMNEENFQTVKNTDDEEEDERGKRRGGGGNFHLQQQIEMTMSDDPQLVKR